MISKGNFTSYAGFIFFLVLSGIVLQSRKSWMANYLIGVEMCVCARACGCNRNLVPARAFHLLNVRPLRVTGGPI